MLVQEDYGVRDHGVYQHQSQGLVCFSVILKLVQE